MAVPPGIPAGAAPARCAAPGPPDRATKTTTRSATATPETIQGITWFLPALRREAPSGVPQTWQKRAPAVSGAAQTEQLAPARAAPQLLQNLPDVSLPQLGHFMQGSWW
ncbi:MAG: hypothetical protein A3K13_01640 [Gemmatimonadetes bacterium RIFCSPLOWO2_12_FULL_68_9]|nr:MAG: hypothetical protein A3K13_01640 [Gemmatimonadetes bacterium RIFCSPLOWO2_12_FULL_68_9]